MTVFRTRSAHRKSPASARNPSTSPVVNQLTQSSWHGSAAALTLISRGRLAVVHWCDRMESGKGQRTMPNKPVGADASRAVAAAGNAFGTDLYQVLAEQTTDTVFSPVNVAGVLLMALC